MIYVNYTAGFKGNQTKVIAFLEVIHHTAQAPLDVFEFPSFRHTSTGIDQKDIVGGNVRTILRGFELDGTQDILVGVFGMRVVTAKSIFCLDVHDVRNQRFGTDYVSLAEINFFP